MTHAVVLTAGLGTRLQPLTFIRAKPAVPVAGEPLVRRIIGWLVGHGVRDLVLNLHHLPHTVTGSVGDGADLGARVRYSWEQPQVLGTAGGPRRALGIIGASTFLVVNGDTLTDVNVSALCDAHNTSGALVTLALVPNPSPDRYGGVRLDRGGQVVRFEPPGSADTHHFVGVQVVQAEVFSTLTDGEPVSSIGGVYDRLIATKPGAVRGVLTDATFVDIGTFTDYWTTSWLFDHGGISSRASRAALDPSARVTQSILWDDVEVEANCVIDQCVLTDRVRVPPGAQFRRTILMRGPDATLRAVPFPS